MNIKRCPCCNSQETKLEKLDDLAVRRCEDCSLVYSNAQASNYETIYCDSRSLYSSYLGYFDRLHEIAGDVGPKLTSVEKQVALSLRNFNEGAILDIGCGIGRFAKSMRYKGWKISLIEASAHLRDKLTSLGYEIFDGVESYISHADSPEEKPLIVTMFEVIEHVEKPREFVEDIIKRVKPDSMYVSVPISESRRKIDEKFKREDIPPNHLTWWNEKSLAKLFDFPGAQINIKMVKPSRKELIFLIINRDYTSLKKVACALLCRPAFWYLCEVRFEKCSISGR